MANRFGLGVQTEMRALKSTFCIMRPDLLSAYAQSVTAANGMPSPEFWQIIADSIEFSVDQLHKVRLVSIFPSPIPSHPCLVSLWQCLNASRDVDFSESWCLS